jgi:hypothetical protein
MKGLATSPPQVPPKKPLMEEEGLSMPLATSPPQVPPKKPLMEEEGLSMPGNEFKKWQVPTNS